MIALSMSETRANTADSTTSRILDVAERLVQTRGFNGFSYADIAAEVGITKASLHYHFATKAELGRTLIARYSDAFATALRAISAQRPRADARLHAYVQLYAEVLAQARMCLCGMVAAEYSTLPVPMQEAIRAFFELNESWLTGLLEQGRREGCLVLRVAPAEAARMLVGALEGEMLVARAYHDPRRFAAAAQLLLAQLSAPHARSPRPVRSGRRSAAATVRRRLAGAPRPRRG
jgi:TetR/AcrR family transcriptional regulator, transcriptional repressor for nem operon